MTAPEYPRRWSATITCDDGSTWTAKQSDHDLQRDQLRSAVAEVAEYLPRGYAAEVQLHKTTKAHGTVRDLSVTLYRDRRSGAIITTR